MLQQPLQNQQPMQPCLVRGTSRVRLPDPSEAVGWEHLSRCEWCQHVIAPGFGIHRMQRNAEPLLLDSTV